MKHIDKCVDREPLAMLHVTSAPDDEALSEAARRQAMNFAIPDEIAISSIFGWACDPKTWSGAPNNVASAFERLGVGVTDIFPRVTTFEKVLHGARYVFSGYGRIPMSLSLFRGVAVRKLRAQRIAAAARAKKVTRVLHTGTLDLPAVDTNRVDHYLYCDHTWDLWLRHVEADDPHTPKARAEFDAMDRACYAQMRHIFTFGSYVRDNLISIYGVAPDRVTAVGSGMGQIDPYFGPKAYDDNLLLFVAKHCFALKGGQLVLDAFRIAKRSRPELRLVVVWDGRDEALPKLYPEVEFRSNLRWGVLTRLYRQATLLVQPMLNDPWGQVYLEALVSRTPIIGLNRNGLPEITENGRHGFLVDEPTPEALAAVMLDAVSDTKRLDSMGRSGQRHVLQTHSWDRVAQCMAPIMAST
jgi:glycosyltransferase involved in cell wall biosynthesis